MRNVMLALGILIASALLAPATWAQQAQPATPTQQTATHADACTPINAQAAAGSQTTLTIPAPAGNQYLYIAEIDFDNVVSTALGGALAVTNVTTTNLGGLKWAVSLPTTANTNYPRGPFTYGPGGLRSVTAGTAVTIVGVTATGNLTQTINACYWTGY
jgi:hypothetical protein